ncbi:MAG: type VI secretion system-associated FHA domain protein, partial [Limisphaerales bacterium]
PYLFNWSKTPSGVEGQSAAPEVAEDLDKALNELKYHQLAFLSGFRNSVKEGTKELLKKVDPEAIEREISNGGFRLAGLKIPFKLSPFKHKRLWKEFYKRYEELLQEEEQQLEAKFRPHFRQGYIGFMASKPGTKDEPK